MPLHRCIVALELKIDRISDALHQAANNLGFADESYAGFPAEFAAKIGNSKWGTAFRQAGVGIVGVGKRRCAVLLSSDSSKSTQDPVLQAYFADRFWRKYLQTVEH